MGFDDAFKEPKRRAPAAAPVDPAKVEQYGPYAAKALADEVAAMARQTEPGRNHMLNRCAFNLGTLVGAGVLNENDVRAQLEAAALSTDLPASEVYSALNSGMESGKKEPRPLPERTYEGMSDWIKRHDLGRSQNGTRATSQAGGPEGAGSSPTSPGDARVTWQPVDIAPYLDGTIEPIETDTGLCRRDGLRLVYAGREHTVIGEMESGKSWFCIACVAAELMAGHHVVYIHFEESDPADTLGRLQLLGVPNHVILERFRFVAPNEPGDVFDLTALLDPTPTLVVLDGVNEAMSLHQMGIREEDGAATFRRRLVKPCTKLGAAVLSADHVVKDRDKRDRSPLGSIHKGNGLTGSLILLENAEPFGRGQRGCSNVFITKDRPGHLRRNGRKTPTPGKTFMGSLIVDDTRTWTDRLDLAFIEPQDLADKPATSEPDGDDADDAQVLAVVTELVGKAGKQPVRTVRAKTKGIGNGRIDNALERLVLDGKLTETSGPKNSRLFSVPGDPDDSVRSGES